jgi:hypothetical protein
MKGFFIVTISSLALFFIHDIHYPQSQYLQISL